MSFPKAKIKRFNDIPITTPSPAEYNVNIKKNPIMGVIPQSDRFTEPRSPPSSDAGSTKSTPCFRTPTLLKKKKIIAFDLKPKLQNLRLTDRKY
ncbi:hypothetical protein HHI36_010811 [Cryptolaemus montrouzieri]|uniref:Uncharacterized protein n=1 Tax=Cryptolaemus montrouzieri TaxID=559131 RepID=A0ABD2MJX4_9CUCU